MNFFNMKHKWVAKVLVKIQFYVNLMKILSIIKSYIFASIVEKREIILRKFAKNNLICEMFNE